jgi:hypothetical protein
VQKTNEGWVELASFEAALLMVVIASRSFFARDHHNPKRERGTQEGRRRKGHKSIPHSRFGLRTT